MDLLETNKEGTTEAFKMVNRLKDTTDHINIAAARMIKRAKVGCGWRCSPTVNS
jgi:hypothetical protein